jgi:hypothetical protein
MNAIGFLTIAAVIVVTIGDPLFVHIIRARAPSAFTAAGRPSPVWIAILTPFYLGPYMGYVLRRDFRADLVRGSKLYALANALYILHLVLVSLGVFWVCLLVWFIFR